MRPRLATALILALASMTASSPGADPAGTIDDPIIDSKMTEAEIFDGLDPNCPQDLRDRQSIVTVRYWGFDQKVHQGQIVVDRDLAKDVSEVFAIALEHKFPIRSVLPASHPKFRVKGRWDDDAMMAADNTSGFNYRPITGGTNLSNHALGRAVDVNTFLNPYVKGIKVLPPGAKYDPAAPGTLTADHPVTKAFLDRGWSWGGQWTSLKDYQHFEKAPRRGQ
ncbi:M15 family metallopeptidase [Tundrisphaera sp. TA3]|uniref:M15 family metallopeptidase n=1 Tax=Tundrisphaera sp. TA3 TaxID=3435775 RepID=UPI003EBD5E73